MEEDYISEENVWSRGGNFFYLLQYNFIDTSHLLHLFIFPTLFSHTIGESMLIQLNVILNRC